MRYPLTAVFLLALCNSAAAYIGPGLGVGILGVIVGILASLLLALVAIVWFPVKRLLQHKKRKATPAEPAEPTPTEEQSPSDGAPD